MYERMSNLTNKGKPLVFKSLAISKIVHISLITTVQRNNKSTQQMQKTLYGTKKIQI